MIRCLATMIAVATTVCAVVSPSLGEPFYKGKTVRILTSESGSGYDATARLVARHLPAHIDGGLTAVVQTMPGATIKIPLYLSTVVRGDSTVIGAINNAVAFAPLLGVPQADFDPTTFNWLGSPSTEVGLVLVWHTVPVYTIEDARNRELIMGVGNGSSSATFYGRLLNEVLGVKFRLLQGYAGMAQAFLAMERGETEGFPSTLWNSLKSTKAEWLAEKKVRMLVQYGRNPAPDLPDVPVARDLVRSDEDRMLLDAAVAPLDMGRPFTMPPGADPENVRVMRTAIMATFTDPAFVEEAEKLHFDVDKTPKSGDDLLAIVRRVYAAPEVVRTRLQNLYKQN